MRDYTVKLSYSGGIMANRDTSRVSGNTRRGEGCITQKKRTRFGDFQNPSGIFRDFHGFLGIFEGFQIKKIPEKNQQLHKNFTFTLVLCHY